MKKTWREREAQFKDLIDRGILVRGKNGYWKLNTDWFIPLVPSKGRVHHATYRQIKR